MTIFIMLLISNCNLAKPYKTPPPPAPCRIFFCSLCICCTKSLFLFHITPMYSNVRTSTTLPTPCSGCHCFQHTGIMSHLNALTAISHAQFNYSAFYGEGAAKWPAQLLFILHMALNILPSVGITNEMNRILECAVV